MKEHDVLAPVIRFEKWVTEIWSIWSNDENDFAGTKNRVGFTEMACTCEKKVLIFKEKIKTSYQLFIRLYSHLRPYKNKLERDGRMPRRLHVVQEPDIAFDNGLI